MRTDLHMHSTASDGVYAPSEVVKIALTNGVDAIALTDHDNTAGINPAQQAAGDRLIVLSGVELSSEDGEADRHILGYDFDTENAPLQTLLATLRDGRINRVQLMVERLASQGIKVSLERVYAIAGEGSVGRPHLARALVESGYVGSISDAFNLYIGDHCPAYVPHYRLAPEDAIKALHAAGGVAVLAHPGHYQDFPHIIESLVQQGLDGIEVYYPDHNGETVDHLRVLAAEHNLLMTIGSDFHRREGDGSARIGSVKAPKDFDPVAAIRERAKRYRS